MEDFKETKNWRENISPNLNKIINAQSPLSEKLASLQSLLKQTRGDKDNYSNVKVIHFILELNKREESLIPLSKALAKTNSNFVNSLIYISEFLKNLYLNKENDEFFRNEEMKRKILEGILKITRGKLFLEEFLNFAAFELFAFEIKKFIDFMDMKGRNEIDSFPLFLENNLKQNNNLEKKITEENFFIELFKRIINKSIIKFSYEKLVILNKALTNLEEIKTENLNSKNLFFKTEVLLKYFSILLSINIINLFCGNEIDFSKLQLIFLKLQKNKLNLENDIQQRNRFYLLKIDYSILKEIISFLINKRDELINNKKFNESLLNKEFINSMKKLFINGNILRESSIEENQNKKDKSNGQETRSNLLELSQTLLNLYLSMDFQSASNPQLINNFKKPGCSESITNFNYLKDLNNLIKTEKLVNKNDYLIKALSLSLISAEKTISKQNFLKNLIKNHKFLFIELFSNFENSIQINWFEAISKLKKDQLIDFENSEFNFLFSEKLFSNFDSLLRNEFIPFHSNEKSIENIQKEEKREKGFHFNSILHSFFLIILKNRFKETILEHNIITLKNSFENLKLKNIAKMVSLNEFEVENIIFELIKKRKINAKIDQFEGLLYILDSKRLNSFEYSIGKGNDLIKGIEEIERMIDREKVEDNNSIVT